jgi:hypothetical protein
MPEAISSGPQVNGILETSLYVERPTRSVEFYRRVFGFEPIDTDPKEGITDETRLCDACRGPQRTPTVQKRHYSRHKTQRARSTLPSAFHGRNYQHGRPGCRSRGLRLS